MWEGVVGGVRGRTSGPGRVLIDREADCDYDKDDVKLLDTWSSYFLSQLLRCTLLTMQAGPPET